eukprot:552239_1
MNMMGSRNTKQEKMRWQTVYDYLKFDIEPWYSMNIKTFYEYTEMNDKELKNIMHPRGKFVNEFKKRFNNDWVNVFVFNEVTYVGLQSRKEDYERDKINNTNHVEKYIAMGYYNKRKL